MNKKWFLLFGLISTASADNRLWLSADYEREMEAEFLSAEGEMVTINRNGHILTFKKSRLSKEDNAWIAKLRQPLPKLPEVSAENFAASDFGKAILKAKKLKGSAFAKSALGSVPKLFLLYYSASW